MRIKRGAAGSFDQRITLQNKVVVKNSIGEEVFTWADFATVWASFRAGSTQERVLGAQLQVEFDAIFRIRKLPNLQGVLLDTDGLPISDTNGDYLRDAEYEPSDALTFGIDEETRIKWRGETFEVTGRPVTHDPRTGEIEFYATRGIRDGR